MAAGIALVPARPASAAGQLPPTAPRLASSSSAPSEPEPVARVVQLDAIVTDRSGKPLQDLGPEDFEVVENGVLQKLNGVEWRGAAAAAPAVEPVLTPEDERRAAREPGTRVMALLLDEFHVSPGAASARVREAFLRFLDDQVRPSDLLVVLKPLESITDIRFTRDRAAARAAIDSFAGRKGDYEARSEFERKYIGRTPAAVRAARAQIVLSGLRALTSRLDELGAGRSAIVIASEGVAQPDDRRMWRRVPDLQGLIRAASRANVAIYAFDPAGAVDARPDGPPADAAGEDGRTFLQTIAVETGGEAVVTPADFSAGLQRVSRDLDGYYLLSYTSSHPGDGRFYDVQIRVRPAGARVRARTGYWAPVRTELLTASSRRATPPRIIRRSPLIQTWLGLTVDAHGTHLMTFTWTPSDVRGRPAAALPKPSVVALKATTKEGAVLFEGEIGAAGTRAMGVVREDAAFFEAGPGPVQLDLVIFASDGSQIDQAAQDVEVPDTKRADPLLLPPHVFSSSSAKEFRETSGNPDAAPTPVREFRRTERLLVRAPAFSSSGAAVTVTARVLNRSGQPLRDIKPMRRSGNDIATQFDLPLSWLAPGEYTIELNATNAAGTAREIVRIRVTG